MERSDLNYLQSGMSTLGLNTPVSRFVALFAVTTIIYTHVKEDRHLPRSHGRERMNIPWWVPGLAIGAAGALFI